MGELVIGGARLAAGFLVLFAGVVVAVAARGETDILYAAALIVAGASVLAWGNAARRSHLLTNRALSAHPPPSRPR